MKTFIGPQLRRLRRQRNETQAEMAKALGISTSYVNMLENNDRSISAAVLLKLLEAYGVDWREISESDNTTLLADLRSAFQDPLFQQVKPDLTQLRAALVHCPDLAASLLKLHQAYLSALEHLSTGVGADHGQEFFVASPEAVVHEFFRRQKNHFEVLEIAAGDILREQDPTMDEVYSWAKRRLQTTLGISVQLVPVSQMPHALRRYDADRRSVLLSEALDHPNRVFQLLHVSCLIEHEELLESLVEQASIEDDGGRARCKVELANYYAAAVLMPYRRFLDEARSSQYDFDHLATRFGVSFEQACHRVVTLGKAGEMGVPFFFLRIDRAGNVTKRFNATDFPLAEHGGACPLLDVHGCFRTPGRVVSQLVEMPDSSRFLVFARTVDRPTLTRHSQDVRLAVAMGCSVEHATSIGYADDLRLEAAHATKIGINCRICPRSRCDQRAQQGLTLPGLVDTNLRGATRYDT